MPDILQTSDHYKHSRKWTLTGKWGEECVVCLVFLLDAQNTPVTKKKSLLGEITHLLRTSKELEVMLQDCELSKRLSKTVLCALTQTRDDIGIECITLLERNISCTRHCHSKQILEDVIRMFYKSSSNPQVASYLAIIITNLISENLELRNEIISNKLVDNLCDSLRPSNEHLQNVILTFLDNLHSYTPLNRILSELRLLTLLNNTISLLSSTVTVSPAIFLIFKIISSCNISSKHKHKLVNQGKLMQGIKHALAYTKTTDVISTALQLLKTLDTPHLISQYNMLDYILECLSSEDERVCMYALELCIVSRHNNKSSVLYISDALLALIDREKERMRGEIIERSLTFLVALSDIRVPEHFHAILTTILKWGNETLITLICLIVTKFTVTFTTIQAMKMLVELLNWLKNNLSQRTVKVPVHTWINSSKEVCGDGEQVLAVILSTMLYLSKSIVDTLLAERDSANFNHKDSVDVSVLRDIVIICDEHLIPPVFSLHTSELCPHVYKHLFAIINYIMLSLFKVYDTGLLSGDNYASKFISKIFGLSKDLFMLRSTLCSSFKHPDVLSTLHTFISTTLCIYTCNITPPHLTANPDTKFSLPDNTYDSKQSLSQSLFSASQQSLNSEQKPVVNRTVSSTVPNAGLAQIIMSGLDVLPYCELQEAFTDSLRTAERPSYHTDLLTHSSFTAHMTCLLLLLINTRNTAQEERKLLQPGPILQVLNLYGTHRLLPSCFTPVLIKLLTTLTCGKVHGLTLVLDTQEQAGNLTCDSYDVDMLLYVLDLKGLNSVTVLKCSLLLLDKVSELGESGGVKEKIGPKVSLLLLKTMIENGKVNDNLQLVQFLVKNCDDTKVIDSLISEMNSSVLLDTSRYDVILSILTTISTTHPVPLNTRCLSTVIQCVLCNAGHLSTSLQYLYSQYIVNSLPIMEMLSNRYDVVSVVCSNIRISSDNLEISLLLLVEHLKRNPDITDDFVPIKLQDVTNIIDSATSTVTLTSLWILLRNNILTSHRTGLGYLALRHVLDSDPLVSLSAAVFVTECGIREKPWYMVLIETSLFLDKIPDGVIVLLAAMEERILHNTLCDKLPALLNKLVNNINNSKYSHIALMHFLSTINSNSPSFTRHTRKFPLLGRECGNVGRECLSHEWKEAGLLYHEASLNPFSDVEITQIRRRYFELMDSFQEC